MTITRPKAEAVDDVTVEVVGRPATFANRGEHEWRAVVTKTVGDRDVPDSTRFEVELEFRLPAPTTGNDAWDLDNLIKPTLDALGGVIGWRRRRGRPKADDERVDRIVANKRAGAAGESPGATIRVTTLVDS